MSENNLLDFYIGETIRFDILAKERDGTALASPSTATMTLRISDSPESASLYSFDTSPEITLADVPTSRFSVILPSATIPLIEEGVTYRYDIYTASAGGDILHQVGGALVLRPGVQG
jgi:hypothetical protein